MAGVSFTGDHLARGRVLDLQPLPSGAPGAWVQPERFPWLQTLIGLDRLKECTR
jgi:hypothetical protein